MITFDTDIDARITEMLMHYTNVIDACNSDLQLKGKDVLPDFIKRRTDAFIQVTQEIKDLWNVTRL